LKLKLGFSDKNYQELRCATYAERIIWLFFTRQR